MITTSTINLYKDSRITPRKNFIIDSLSTYLDTLTKATYTDFQYIKHGLNIEIKLDLSQSELDFDKATKYDYCSIQNSDQEKVVYYFVMDMKWRGQSTLALTLSMDTINTFREGSSFTFDDKTKVNRQHKNRFRVRVEQYTDQFYAGSVSQEYNSTLNFTQWNFESIPYEELIGASVDSVSITCTPDSGTVVPTATPFSVIITSSGVIKFFAIYSGNVASVHMSATIDLTYSVNKYLRVIDLQSEGVTPILYGENKSMIMGDTLSWYLVYKKVTSNPIRCYICADTKVNITINGDSTINPTDLTDNVYYYLSPDIAGYINVTGTGINLSAYNKDTSPFTREKCILVYWKDSTNIKIKAYYYTQVFAFPFSYSQSSAEYSAQSITLTSSNTPITIKTLAIDTHDISVIEAGADETKSLTPSTNTSNGFDELDRTDTDLVKIIKLPYKPFKTTDGIKYDAGEEMIYLENLLLPLENELSVSDYNPLEEMSINLYGIAATDLRNANYESKLFHSDYYQPKFVYDSFTFVFALERINLTDFEISTSFKVEFSVTNTINSKMLFTFPQYVDNGYALEDYSNVLVVARNNEVTILNDDYLNYLKLGYNYDVKSRTRQEVGQWVGTGLSLVGSVASFAIGASGNPLAIASGITLATSAMAQLVSAVNTTAQAEANHNQKMIQLQAQKASVYGADDVDLMTRYTGNKAKLMLYQCSDKMKSVLFDLFFYTGYIDGTMHVPNTTSRRRFNFLSCEPVFKTIDNIPEDILSDIELKMNAGVTYIHYYSGEWDLDQKYENWEANII